MVGPAEVFDRRGDGPKCLVLLRQPGGWARRAEAGARGAADGAAPASVLTTATVMTDALMAAAVKNTPKVLNRMHITKFPK